MVTVAGWVLLTLTAASPAPSHSTHEAVCGLMWLHASERAYFAEKDRYGLPAQVGFLPSPCHDGTRPPVSEPASVGGCGFVFTVLEAGPSPDVLKAEASGVGPGVAGLRYGVDASGTITRTGTGAPVRMPDCDAWRKQADPLWRYHDIVTEKDCMDGPYAEGHPCMTALQELAALAKAGVGVARKEYAAHPTARELVPLEPPSPAMNLCGLLATRELRLAAATTLERQGELVNAVLAPRCQAEGLRAALPRVFARFDAVCPGANCLTLLALANSAELPGRDALFAAHAPLVARLLRAQAPDARRRLLTEVVGLSPPSAGEVNEALQGRWPGLSRLVDLPRWPVVLALFDVARTEHPSLAAPLDLLNEVQGQGPASLGAFRAWAESAPCEQLADADALQLTGARLREIARTHERCQGSTVLVLQRHTATLPPHELMEALEPLPAEKLRWMINELGLDVPSRAEALVDWVVDREPKLLEALNINAAVVRRLLAPRNVSRMGGRDAMLDFLLRGNGTRHGTMEEDAIPVLMSEALRGQPPVERVRHVASLFLGPDEKARVLAGVLQSPDARVRAAAAAGMAEWEDSTGIPADAARACLVEVRLQHRCIGAATEPLGPPPSGTRKLSPLGRRLPRHLSPVPALETWCERVEAAERECGSVCGGAMPQGAKLARLEAAAGETLSPLAALRACTYFDP
ncbi:hypothetical protein [Pyxidicoccus caerfyrddinensis]|uniref:hypothetical protein n=1 Tax=Pyxidicoccus caerfyrddinensis TaxID=2709663 RepID=UPI0013DB4B57|nr:hypothetical protein [Pyxidicoccus caerfyrddinensis]